MPTSSCSLRLSFVEAPVPVGFSNRATQAEPGFSWAALLAQATTSATLTTASGILIWEAMSQLRRELAGRVVKPSGGGIALPIRQ